MGERPMQIPVLIEPVGGNGYQAKPFPFTAEGATPEEALQKLRQLLEGKITSGAKIVHLDVQIEQNPWLRIAGTLDPNDPMVQEWKEIMMENRRKADEDPDYP
jgi:hypothetical protein